MFCSGHCVCYHGWYGEACDQQCPGGSINPCNGHGTCDVFTGACCCPSNFDQSSEDCSTCASGYTGVDCSAYLMIVNDTLQQVTASAYGYGEFITFDGLSYSLPAEGEFTFVNSSDISIYLRLVRTCWLVALLLCKTQQRF